MAVQAGQGVGGERERDTYVCMLGLGSNNLFISPNSAQISKTNFIKYLRLIINQFALCCQNNRQRQDEVVILLLFKIIQKILKGSIIRFKCIYNKIMAKT